jgi:hypothetical protein
LKGEKAVAAAKIIGAFADRVGEIDSLFKDQDAKTPTL